MIRNALVVSRWVALMTVVAALSACSGAGNGLSGTPFVCNTGTQTALAGPTNGQTGVSTSIGQIIVVANGNNNQLYSTYSQWQLTLVDNFGIVTTGGPLRLVPDPSGPHPYPSDFYYASNIPQLNPGQTYRASLSLTAGSCTAVPLGSFST